MTSTLTPGGRGLGLIPDEPDSRDRLYATPPQHPAYEFVDLKKDPATPPVWDQGQLGSCTAHGTLACFLFASAKCGSDDPMLSRLMLYWLTRNIEGTVKQDAGGQIRDAIKATTLGIAPETDWPYDIAKFKTKPPAAAFKDAAANVDLDYQRVEANVDAIQACLSEGFPVDIGVTLFQSFEAQDAIASGVVQMPTAADGEPIGGHCMAVWGIGIGSDWIAAGQFPTANPSTMYVKLRNSWGTDVYQRGYLLIPAAYLPEFGSDFWTIRRVS
jgi:C1A family cysteine protease